MSHPAGRIGPEHAEGDGAATNVSRPHRRKTYPLQDGSSVSTVTPPPSSPKHDPVPGPDPDPRLEFARWVLGDKSVTRRVLMFVVVFLTAAVLIAWVLAPQIGTLGGSLAGAIGGGAMITAVQRGRKVLRARHNLE